MRVVPLKMGDPAAAGSVAILPRGLALKFARQPDRRIPGAHREADEPHGVTPHEEPFLKLQPVAFCSDLKFPGRGSFLSYIRFCQAVGTVVRSKMERASSEKDKAHVSRLRIRLNLPDASAGDQPEQQSEKHRTNDGDDDGVDQTA